MRADKSKGNSQQDVEFNASIPYRFVFYRLSSFDHCYTPIHAYWVGLGVGNPAVCVAAGFLWNLARMVFRMT
jgi:hypothetical protein